MLTDHSWVAVVPVKELAVAKSRLTLPDGARQDLALAMACDVVLACLGSAGLSATLVVTNDARAAAALGSLGATVVADGSDAGLNPALVDGARLAAGWHPRAGVLAVSSDLPALTSETVDEVLAAAAMHERSMVADAAGIGTTMLAARKGAQLGPGFGTGSRNRHVLQGVVELDPARWECARRDIDTLADLRVAAGLGLGSHTASVWSGLALVLGTGR